MHVPAMTVPSTIAANRNWRVRKMFAIRELFMPAVEVVPAVEVMPAVEVLSFRFLRLLLCVGEDRNDRENASCRQERQRVI